MGDFVLKAPFPYFGGKSRCASLVWECFGNVPNYVEPFFGSGAVLLGRPHEPGIETVNDIDCFLANFWRSMQADPEATAKAADRPVNEADLQAIHNWLVTREEFRERMKTDIDYYDPLIAGRWCWGLCCWIGSGWCACDAGQGVNRQLPHLGDAGQGVNRQLPHLGNAGQGVNRQLPHLGNAGRGGIYEYFDALAARLRRVRVACGDWSRVLTPSVTEKNGLTGVFLDPPYSEGNMKYSAGSGNGAEVSTAVREWAIANGDNPMLRIALCGYEGNHKMPDSWECVAWKAHGGYSATRGKSNGNDKRERIWFNKSCLSSKGLFA